MDVGWWALGVSALSMTVSAGSLAWNMHTFKWTGPRVEITLGAGVFVAPVDELTGAFPPMFSGVASRMSEADTRITKSILLVATIRNVGRSPVQVIAPSIHVGPSESSIPFPSGQHRDGRLDAASQFSWQATVFEVINLLARGEIANVKWFRVTANLGDGTTVESQKVLLQELLDQKSRQFPQGQNEESDPVTLPADPIEVGCGGPFGICVWNLIG
jgi:hypothetical protein